jgi:hypothetical protein
MSLIFVNRMLKIILDLNRKKYWEARRKILSEELHNLYYSPNIIKVIMKEDEMSGACGTQ